MFSFPIPRCPRVNAQKNHLRHDILHILFFPYLYQEVKNQALIGFSVVVSSPGIGEFFLTMSRPGPRQYECVRRAWHSDRHQPIRGSLIQEIFRIVNEVHCSGTRKNREWQENLPIVVLKAEEIMYSKACSEAEYSDLKTLWDRVNNAIDTIIRRDEGTEIGEFLQPCIEAALLLGCTPRRTSRSQCNDSPRCYLRPLIPGDTSIPPSTSNHKTFGNLATSNPHIIRDALYVTPDTKNSMYSCLKFGSNHIIRAMNYNDEKSHVLPKKYAGPSDNHHISAQTLTEVNACSVYPLYNNDQIQPSSSNFHSTNPSNSSSCLMDVTPRNLSPDELGCSSFILPPNHNYTSDKGYGVKCDLTLRLGLREVGFKKRSIVTHNSQSSPSRSKFKNCMKVMNQALVHELTETAGSQMKRHSRNQM